MSKLVRKIVDRGLVNTVKGLAAVAVLGAATLLSGCNHEANSDVLKIGVMSGQEADLMQVVVNRLNNEGVKTKLVEFTDYVSPNVALADGSIDVNAYQHKPYLESMEADRGFDLVAVGNTFVYPIGGYSKTLKNIDQLKDGAKVAIPNDPTNEGRTLILLHKAGLLTLKDPANLEATPADIAENPKHLQFIELDAAQLPRALDDVDLAFINSTYSVSAGLLPERDALIVEDKDSPYVNIIASRADNQQDPRIGLLRQAYQSKEVIAKAEELFKGSAVPGWN